MLLVRGAHATTLGFMAAVGRLLFGERITAKKHKRLLQLLTVFFMLGYPVQFWIWTVLLARSAVRGRVVVADGFLVVLSRRTDNPQPSRLQKTVLIMVALGGTAFLVWVFVYLAVPNHRYHAGVVFSVVGVTVGPAMISAALRHRGGDTSRLQGALVVEGLVPTSRSSGLRVRNTAPAWIARQHGPVGWVADEGLKRFYEDILSPWGIEGVKIADGANGFWALLRPTRYLFLCP